MLMHQFDCQEVETLRIEVLRQREVIAELEATTANVCLANEKVLGALRLYSAIRCLVTRKFAVHS
jgi:hypothetical protein